MKLRFSIGPAGCRSGKVLSERRLGYRDGLPRGTRPRDPLCFIITDALGAVFLLLLFISTDTAGVYGAEGFPLQGFPRFSPGVTVPMPFPPSLATLVPLFFTDHSRKPELDPAEVPTGERLFLLECFWTGRGCRPRGTSGMK